MNTCGYYLINNFSDKRKKTEQKNNCFDRTQWLKLCYVSPKFHNIMTSTRTYTQRF